MPPAIRIQARVEGVDKTSAEFKQARRQIQGKQRKGVRQAGEEAVQPLARRTVERHAPVAANQIVIRSTTTTAYIAVRQRRASRIVGWLNYGGILPAVTVRKKRAMVFTSKTGEKVFTRRIGPRRTEGRHFLEQARDQGLPEFERILLARIMESFDTFNTP
jgi:hypothetical protein